MLLLLSLQLPPCTSFFQFCCFRKALHMTELQHSAFAQRKDRTGTSAHLAGTGPVAQPPLCRSPKRVERLQGWLRARLPQSPRVPAATGACRMAGAKEPQPLAQAHLGAGGRRSGRCLPGRGGVQLSQPGPRQLCPAAQCSTGCCVKRCPLSAALTTVCGYSNWPQD